jgi:hypothetical protein
MLQCIYSEVTDTVETKMESMEQFEDKMVSLKAVVEFLKQRAIQEDANADDTSDWDFKQIHRDYAGALDQAALDVVAHFTVEERIAEEFKINNGRSILAHELAMAGIFGSNLVKAERAATIEVAKMNPTDVVLQMIRRGFAWNVDSKRWTKEQ